MCCNILAIAGMLPAAHGQELNSLCNGPRRASLQAYVIYNFYALLLGFVQQVGHAICKLNRTRFLHSATI
jgi:hypothetical protein